MKTRHPNRPDAARAHAEPDALDHRYLRQAAALRAEDTYAAAQQCPQCQATRASHGDGDALCDEHLGRALGVVGGWDLPGRGHVLQQPPAVVSKGNGT